VLHLNRSIKQHYTSEVIKIKELPERWTWTTSTVIKDYKNLDTVILTITRSLSVKQLAFNFENDV